MRYGSKAFRWLIIVIVNLVVLEGAAFLAVFGLGVVSPNRRWDLFLETQLAGVSDESVRHYLANRYDADLGWDNFPGTQRDGRSVLHAPWTARYDASGARVSCLTGAAGNGDPFVATYGDSFTHGDEVNDDETWQCALERRFQRRVTNYGVPGYGADQALLKIKRHWQQGKIAPITIFCVYEDDLRRALNRYRPFLAPDTHGTLGFKPSFRRSNDTVVLLPNPLHSEVSTVKEVKTLAISLIPTDYWARDAARVFPEFPYSMQLLATVLRATRREASTLRFSDNIWNVPEGRAVMLHLLTEFTAGAKRYGTRPVLLMIPKVNYSRDGRMTPPYKAFLREELAGARLDLQVIDVADASFDERKFNLLPFEGHPSAYGNEVIAAAVFEGLGAKRSNGQ